MKLFSVELDNLQNKMLPRVELDYKFSELNKEDIQRIHDLISKCYKDIMTIYINKKEITK